MSVDALGASDTPLRFATKAEAVYGEIRRRILNGILEPSAPLNQDALAPELGVSVTPVREAIRRLEAEGLVQFQAHKTVIVTPLTRNELGEIYDVRLQLDPYAASLAATAATEDDLREIERLSGARPSKDPLEQVRVNRAFHRAIYARSGNRTLTDILDRLWERTDRYRVMLLARDTELLAAMREHIEIVEAMRSKQPRLVAKLVRAHVAKAQGLIGDALAR
jgi:DNA-binding GntR family transcriptional regulator